MRYNSGSSSFGGGMLPPAVKGLIIANVVVFLLQQLAGNIMTFYFGLVPAAFWHGFIWQPFTYMFMHGSFMHILFNMFVLWMFGRTLEEIWGKKKFLTYYFITGVGAGILNAAIMPGSTIPTVGASGAVYGLLLAYGILFPNQTIYFYMILPIKAKYFVIIVALIEFFSGLNPSSNVAHFAHLGGMIFGLLYLKWPQWIRKAQQVRDEQKSEAKIRIVYNKREEISKLQEEVDELLDKINKEGLDNLSSKEKQHLKEASRKLKEWEEQGH